MERTITGFHQDDVGDWVAELECGHNQHVRHRPPFQLREWVLDERSRGARVGAALECPLCDRGELPTYVRHVRNSPLWDATSMPAGLRREHKLGQATWGILHVEAGALRFDTEAMRAGQTRVIPPGVAHQVEPMGDVGFWIEFLAVDRGAASGQPAPAARVELDGDDAAGDPACWAGLLCPECGAVMDGGPHKAGCAGG